jgi:hypothetical protein
VNTPSSITPPIFSPTPTPHHNKSIRQQKPKSPLTHSAASPGYDVSQLLSLDGGLMLLISLLVLATMALNLPAAFAAAFNYGAMAAAAFTPGMVSCTLS